MLLVGRFADHWARAWASDECDRGKDWHLQGVWGEWSRTKLTERQGGVGHWNGGLRRAGAFLCDVYLRGRRGNTMVLLRPSNSEIRWIICFRHVDPGSALSVLSSHWAFFSSWKTITDHLFVRKFQNIQPLLMILKPLHTYLLTSRLLFSHTFLKPIDI